jgi:hypothetical protein
MFVVQIQRLRNPAFFMVPLQLMMNVLMIVEGKWLKEIVHMMEFAFLNLPHPKQVQLISILVGGKFLLSLVSTFLVLVNENLCSSSGVAQEKKIG